jgi:hypothetical protein
MTTKTPIELSSTPSVVDNGNATAITIDSSERVGILQSSPTSNLHIGASGNDAKRELRIDGTNGSGQTFGFITEADGENGRVSFKVGQSNATPAQKLMIHPDGGICFGSDTAAANALDDYEEGYWTPTLNGGTISTIYSAKYTKIGNVVHYYVYLLLSFVNNSNRFEISVPFNTSSVTNETYPVGAIGYSGTVDTQDLRPHVMKNSNPGFIYFHQVDGSTGAQTTNANMYARNYGDGRVTALLVTGSYYTE